MLLLCCLRDTASWCPAPYDLDVWRRLHAAYVLRNQPILIGPALHLHYRLFPELAAYRVQNDEGERPWGHPTDFKVLATNLESTGITGVCAIHHIYKKAVLFTAKGLVRRISVNDALEKACCRLDTLLLAIIESTRHGLVLCLVTAATVESEYSCAIAEMLLRAAMLPAGGCWVNPGCSPTPEECNTP